MPDSSIAPASTAAEAELGIELAGAKQQSRDRGIEGLASPLPAGIDPAAIVTAAIDAEGRAGGVALDGPYAQRSTSNVQLPMSEPGIEGRAGSPLPAGIEDAAAAPLTPFEAEVVGIFHEIGQTVGFARSHAEIYGLLFASVRPLTFTQIQDKLGLSKGAVSIGLRALRDAGAISAERGEDPRREHYVASLELRKIVAQAMGEKLAPRLKEGAARVKALEALLPDSKAGPDLRAGRVGAPNAAVPPTASDERAVLLARVKKLESWRGKAAKLLPFISKFLG